MDFSTLNRIICNALGVDERHISGYIMTADKKGLTIEVVWLPEWADVEPKQTKWNLKPTSGEVVLLGNGAKPGKNQETDMPPGYKGEWHMDPEAVARKAAASGQGG